MYELRLYWMIISNLAKGGVGGIFKVLRVSNFNSCAKQKSLKRPPTIRITD